MSTTRRMLATAALAALAACSSTSASQPEPARSSMTVTCFEDEPCWDCNVHGNGLCSADDPTPFEP